LIGYFVGNISTKNIKIYSHVLELEQAKGGTFFETRCNQLNCYRQLQLLPIVIYV